MINCKIAFVVGCAIGVDSSSSDTASAIVGVACCYGTGGVGGAADAVGIAFAGYAGGTDLLVVLILMVELVLIMFVLTLVVLSETCRDFDICFVYLQPEGCHFEI